MNISQRLQKLMDEQAVTPYRLSKELDVHASTIKNWLDGKEPRLEYLHNVARFFDVTVDYLTGNSDDPQGIKIKPTATNDDELNNVYFNFAKDAQDSGIHPDDIKDAIEMIKRLRGK